MIAKAVLLSIFVAAAPAFAQHADRPGHVGASVMPFDLRRSLHVFTPDAAGGTQSVVSRDGDQQQIALIRAHLLKEAQAFRRGDYADPAAIHGPGMAGIADLRAGAGRILVGYEPLPVGARIRFRTKDLALVEALHRWFAAQLRDHGADAASKL